MGERGKKLNLNWTELEKDFILGDYKSLKDFAEKKGLTMSGNFNNQTTGWTKKKKNKQKKKAEKVIEKTIEKEAEKQAALNIRHLKVTDKLLTAIEKALSKDDELYTYVEKLRTGYGMGEFSEEITCEVLKTINDAKLLNIVNAMDKIQKLQRQSMKIMDERDKVKLDIERERLDIEKKKQEQEDKPSEIRVVLEGDLDKWGT